MCQATGVRFPVTNPERLWGPPTFQLMGRSMCVEEFVDLYFRRPPYALKM
jgi:hypothetical protein